MSFSQGATGLSQLPSCLEWIKGVTVESVQGNPVYLEWTWTMGSFRIVARPQKFTSSIKWILPALEVQQERQDSLPDTEKWTLLSRRGGRTRALLQLWWDPWCSSRVQTGMSGNFLSCLKGVKDPFGAQEGRWDFSRYTAAEKGFSSCAEENLLIFFELRRGSSQLSS